MKRFLALMFFLAAVAFPGGGGKQTVTTSGTPVQLISTPQPVTGCTITALAGNSGTIWLNWSSSVSAANSIGTPLGPSTTSGQPGASYTCMPPGNAPIFQLSNLWLDATHSGDGVSFSWF